MDAFLLDPSPIVAVPCLSVTPSVTDVVGCWGLTDVTLACGEMRVAAEYLMERSFLLLMSEQNESYVVDARTKQKQCC